MSDHFVMLWGDMLASSIIEEEVHVKWAFVVCLLLCDSDGNFRSTSAYLARIGGMTLEEAEAALAVLSEPDDHSTSKIAGGCRLISLGPNQWHVVNYKEYKQRQRDEELKTKWREDKRRQRGTLVDSDGRVVDSDGPTVDPVSVSVSVSVCDEEEGESERESKKGKKKTSRFIPPTLEEVEEYIKEKGLLVDPQGFIDFYESKGWMVGKNKMKVWGAACRRAEKWDTNLKMFKDQIPKEKKPLGEFGLAAKRKTERLAKERAEAEKEGW